VRPLLEQGPTAQDLIRNRHKKESQGERVAEGESLRESDQRMVGLGADAVREEA